MVEQVSARTLRRHTSRIESQTQALLQRLDFLLNRIAEQAERLCQMEGDVEKLQKYTGVIAARRLEELR